MTKIYQNVYFYRPGHQRKRKIMVIFLAYIFSLSSEDIKESQMWYP